MRKKLLITMLSVGLAMMSLAGCGANEETNTQHASANKQHETKNNQSVDERVSATVSSAIKEGEYSIWYSCDKVDKDQRADITVMYPDGTYISTRGAWGYDYDVNFSRYSLKELSSMSNEEIVSFVESCWAELVDKKAQGTEKNQFGAYAEAQGYPGYYEYYVSGDKSKMEEQVELMGMVAREYVAGGEIEGMISPFFEQRIISEFTRYKEAFETDYDDSLVAEFEDKIHNLDTESIINDYIAEASAVCGAEFSKIEVGAKATPQKGTYTISAKTDASGNKILSEKIEFSNDDAIEIISLLPPQPIYDVFYGGYGVKSYNADIFVIRTNNNVSFYLDDMDTEGITID